MIEGIADGLAGAARLGGGALADDPGRRRSVAVGGYATTAVLSGLIGAAGTAWQVGVLRAGAWTARGLRVPARNALLADVVPAAVYGRAYGFERAMDNLGAIGGPLLAIALVGLIGVRSAILLSIIPGLLAAVAIVYAIRHTALPTVREHRPIRLRIRPLMRGQLGRLLATAFAFELGNLAATLLILRATELLQPGRSHTSAAQLALVLYAGYNLAATLASIPAGHVGDRHGLLRILGAGAACFLISYVGFAFSGESFALLAGCFILAGIGIGCAETAETAVVARLAPDAHPRLRVRATRGTSSGREPRRQRGRRSSLDRRLTHRGIPLRRRLDARRTRRPGSHQPIRPNRRPHDRGPQSHQCRSLSRGSQRPCSSPIARISPRPSRRPDGVRRESSRGRSRPSETSPMRSQSGLVPRC